MSPTGGPGQHEREGPGANPPGAAGPAGASQQMVIVSDYAAAREVQHRVREEVERCGFDPDSQFAIKLALEEALINAIKHGNKLDPAKHVHVEWRVSPKALEIAVEDEGPGFERCFVPDPTCETNLEKLTGRGILLMEAYMNRVEWSKGGRRVVMVKENGKKN